jgi:acyl-CoA reductase-like NAD-dependent aldehyde dehydrogenase
MSDTRITVAKTYKLYVGGAFPRSESGRSYQVTDSHGAFLANAAQASRKDARDAVAAARKAFPGWSGATAYNRGQVLYRVAELLEGRREQFVAELTASEGTPARRAQSLVDAAVDRWVWYAGWTDKLASVLGAANPVAGPYFSFTVPEPTGVVAVLAPQSSSLLGLVSVIAPVLAAGNGDVNALDLSGAATEQRAELERAAAGTVKRVLRVPADEPDWTGTPDIARLRAFLEAKTVWHPIGV